MEKQIRIKSEYNSLEKVSDFFKKESPYEASIDYDIWDVRTDANGQMENCVVVKKSAMHGLKLYFTKENVLQVNYLIPNKLMNVYFGDSKRKYRSILQVVTGGIKKAILVGPQKQAFEEISLPLNKIKL